MSGAEGAMREHIVFETNGVSHWFGENRVLSDVNIEVVRGQILSLVGPSGCGKSTLLRAVVGTHPPKKGELIVYSGKNGEPGKHLRGPGRDRGIVYQQYSLFPFLTAQQNVALGPMLDETSLPLRFFRYRKWRKMRKVHMDLAAFYLEKVQLGHALKLYPSNLSGGMRQRVAIAQALIMKPKILLLDEPFGALDEATREELQTLLLTLYSENCQARAKGEEPAYTIILVTHELNEAIYVGDRIVGLSQYWDWQAEGHKTCPGATVVYDKAAPVFRPGDERNYEALVKQRSEIRDAVFDPIHCRERNEFRIFWKQVRAGEVGGIFEDAKGREV